MPIENDKYCVGNAKVNISSTYHRYHQHIVLAFIIKFTYFTSYGVTNIPLSVAILFVIAMYFRL